MSTARFRRCPTTGQARRAIDRVVDRLRKRRGRRAGRRRLVESEAKTKRRGRQGQAVEVKAGGPYPTPMWQVGVPTLCRHLAALGKGTPFDAEIATLVAATATVLVADRDVLRPEELGFFTLAWSRGRSAAEIAARVGISPRAMTERLRRISNKVEKAITDYLHAVLSPQHGDRLAALLRSVTAPKRKRNSATRYNSEVCEHVVAALEALIHRDS